ncbi:hypothetical protein ACFFQF_03555 [Haladaptatus pallidirubidus]|uniref:Uncharacterized protein n=1 Tax=Haladaptatus pallidirubidus TaxID=1008152 RepID=A0AAV3UKM3_9EURY|nr:hypothetical protein [Haladaptatus pallidirubidus]
MFGSEKITSNRILAGLFVLMLLLAGVIFLTGSDIARQLLRLLVPLSGVTFALVSLTDAESRIERVAVVVLAVSCSIGIYLEIVGAGVFSNLLVNIAIIASVMFVGNSQGNDGPESSYPPSGETSKKPRFWENPRSALPSSESVLIAILLLGAVGVFLDLMSIDVVGNLTEAVESNPLQFLSLVGFYLLSKSVDIGRHYIDESWLEKE